MANNNGFLGPPDVNSQKTFSGPFKTWLYQLWKWVTQVLPQGLTYGTDVYTYSQAIAASAAGGEGVPGVSWPGGLGNGWSAYTPTLTPLSGAYTTASASGQYALMGNLVFFNVQVSITTVGTGGVPQVTLPVKAAGVSGVICTASGRETAVTGKSLNAAISGGSTTTAIFNYDNTSPAANGVLCCISGVYMKA